jgi:hypothetical protein
MQQHQGSQGFIPLFWSGSCFHRSLPQISVMSVSLVHTRYEANRDDARINILYTLDWLHQIALVGLRQVFALAI